jgi:hypothetical protein
MFEGGDEVVVSLCLSILSALLSGQKIKLNQAESILLLDLLPFLGELKVPFTHTYAHTRAPTHSHTRPHRDATTHCTLAAAYQRSIICDWRCRITPRSTSALWPRSCTYASSHEIGPGSATAPQKQVTTHTNTHTTRARALTVTHLLPRVSNPRHDRARTQKRRRCSARTWSRYWRSSGTRCCR